MNKNNDIINYNNYKNEGRKEFKDLSNKEF